MATHRIPHGLSLPLAQRATRAALESYRDQFPDNDPSGRWLSPSHARVEFTAGGRRLGGDVHVGPDFIHLELEVPFIFRPFRAAAMKIIEQEIRLWISRAKQGQLPSPSGDDE